MRYRENLHSIYILLFLNIAFYVFQVQDPQKYQFLFAFDGPRFLAGEYWRVVTYQFVQQGAISLFFNLLILYIMGSAVEEVYGTFHFVAFVLLSTLGSAGIAFLLGVPLLGSFFASFALLFIFATMVPEQVFYLFFVIPVKVKWLAWLALGWLAFQVVGRSPVAIAALGGSALTYAYYYLRFHTPLARVTPQSRPRFAPVAPSEQAEPGREPEAEKNLARFAAMKQALGSGDGAQVRDLIAAIEPDVVRGVNICPPADYKPEHEDRYCIRCEGFAECSIRYLKLESVKRGESASGEREVAPT